MSSGRAFDDGFYTVVDGMIGRTTERSVQSPDRRGLADSSASGRTGQQDEAPMAAQAAVGAFVCGLLAPGYRLLAFG
jgi:hypothetical protein